MIPLLGSLFCHNTDAKDDSPKIVYSWSGKVSVSADEVIRSHKFKEQMKKTNAFFEAKKKATASSPSS